MKQFRTACAILLLLLALPLASHPARAAEAITRFVSDLTVNLDSSVTVTETITFNAEGQQIKRGILRDFPTRYKTPNGEDYAVGFSVIAVKRDGADEAWGTEGIANGVRIRIGRADVLLDPGLHTYEITYRATGELGFFESFDEIYWNVTGNAWTFPIETAEAIIHLPEGASVIRHSAYTGSQGAQGQDFRVTGSTGRIFRADTARPLEVNEGFTVAVAFTKGIVPPPPDYTVTSYKVLAGGAGLLFLYYLLAWLIVGRDPGGGPVIPRWAAPDGLGPAGVRFIWNRTFDDKSFAAAMIGLAAKGRIRITHGEAYEIEKLGKEGPPLAATEQALYGQMPKKLKVKRENAGALSVMWSSLSHSLKAEFDRSTYHRNRVWFWVGLLLSVLVLIPALAFVRPEEFTVALLVVYVCGAIWALVLWLAIRGLRAFRTSILGAVFLLIVCLPVGLFGWIFQTALMKGIMGPTLWVYMAALAALAAMHIAFIRLLPAHTAMGAKLKAEVGGLRLYMVTAEEKRLDMLNPPDKTPALFEALLPYAIALDCTNQWSEKFASVLAAASYAGPSWYQGAILMDDMGDFTRNLDNNRHPPSTGGGGGGGSSSFSTSSSSWSPGSSSGSSGGGSSGGGGGSGW